MTLSVSRSCGLLLAVAALVLAPAVLAAEEGAPAPDAPKGGVWTEKFGIGLGGFAVTFNGTGFDLSPVNLLGGPTLFLRGPTRRWDRLYWTTFEIAGGFVGAGGDTIGGVHGFAGSELGFVLFDTELVEVNAGLQVAGGLIWYPGLKGGEDSGDFGAYGLTFAPVIGVKAKSTGSVTFGVSARLYIPTMAPDNYSNYTTALLISLDLGIR